MDETTLDSEYLKQLKPSFLHLFVNYVKPCNVICFFHKYNINVLTENDVENIRALAEKKGDREGSMLLFERLVLYKGWYDCLLQVLRDRDVCLSHVAHEMEECKGLLDEKILSEQSDDQTQTTYQWLTGLSVLTSGLTTVLRVTPHTKNLNNLKVDPILEMKSLKLKVELEILKKELDDIKQNLRDQIQSYEQQLLEANSVLSRDSSDVDKIAGKMCEFCKTVKEMLKQNEILQTELNHLREAYSDNKAFWEKRNQEKEVLQSEHDHLEKILSDRNDSYEKLHQEKEILQTEFNHLREAYSDNKAFCEKLNQEKEVLQYELDHLEKKLSDRNDSYEKLHQEKEKLQTELNQLTQEFSDSFAQPEKAKRKLLKDEEENNESGSEICDCTRLEEEYGLSARPNFIPVNEFSKADLPKPIHHNAVTEYIRQQEKLVVHLYVQGEKKENYGTGFVWTCQDNMEIFDVCPAKQCQIRYPHKGYGGLLVYTNHPVVRDDVEAATCKVTFFYNSGSFIDVEDFICRSVSEHVPTDNLTGSLSSENCSSAPDSKILNTVEKPANTLGTKPVRAYGLKLRECEENKDLVGLKIIYHNPELFDMVRGASKTNLLSKIPNQIKVNWKKYAIVISHPHGGSKVVSVGDIVALEEEDDGVDRPRRTTKYTASTCNGSSGAPVFTGSYSYRPFTHRGKYKGYIVSFSF